MTSIPASNTTYQSKVSKNHFGESLVATKNLPAHVIIQKFQTEATAKAFNGDFNAPLDERHVIVIGEDSKGNLLYGRVISNAKYINHSCDPNCMVTISKEVLTIKPVKENEELTIAYDEGSGKWDARWNFKCLCKATHCRKVIDSYKKTIIRAKL